MPHFWKRRRCRRRRGELSVPRVRALSTVDDQTSTNRTLYVCRYMYIHICIHMNVYEYCYICMRKYCEFLYRRHTHSLHMFVRICNSNLYYPHLYPIKCVTCQRNMNASELVMCSKYINTDIRMWIKQLHFVYSHSLQCLLLGLFVCFLCRPPQLPRCDEVPLRFLFFIYLFICYVFINITIYIWQIPAQSTRAHTCVYTHTHTFRQ